RAERVSAAACQGLSVLDAAGHRSGRDIACLCPRIVGGAIAQSTSLSDRDLLLCAAIALNSAAAEGAFTMPWFRAERSLSSYVALLALALQLAVSFGHVHFDGLALGTATAAAALGPSEPEGGPSGTPDRDDVCAICAVISL